LVQIGGFTRLVQVHNHTIRVPGAAWHEVMRRDTKALARVRDTLSLPKEQKKKGEL
jgi:hypothetical protein